jgi:hypothetical protein
MNKVVRELLLNYRKTLKAELLGNGLISLTIAIIISTLFCLVDLQYNFVTIIIVNIIFSAILRGGLELLSESRYVIFLQLPIKIKDAIKIAYIHIYLSYAVVLVVNMIMFICNHKQGNIFNILLISVYLVVTNIAVPTVKAYEFKISNTSGEKISLFIFLMVIFSIFLEIMIWQGDLVNVENISIKASIFLIIATFLTVRVSYKSTLKKTLAIHNLKLRKFY